MASTSTGQTRATRHDRASQPRRLGCQSELHRRRGRHGAGGRWSAHLLEQRGQRHDRSGEPRRLRTSTRASSPAPKPRSAWRSTASTSTGKPRLRHDRASQPRRFGRQPELHRQRPVSVRDRGRRRSAGHGDAESVRISFPTQPLNTFGTPQSVTITYTGHGVLEIDRARVTGGPLGNFLLFSDTCSGASVPIGGTCMIQLRFGPTAIGTSLAMLTMTSNDIAGALQIALSGVGGPTPRGPQGPPGPPGRSGAIGAAGPTGARGATGAAGGKAQTTALSSPSAAGTSDERSSRRSRASASRSRSHDRSARPRPSPAPSSSGNRIRDRAALTRAGITYARGAELQDGRRPLLLLIGTRGLHAGRYTLRVSWTDRRHHKHATDREISVTA